MSHSAAVYASASHSSEDRQTHRSSCLSSYKLLSFVVEYITFEVLGCFFFACLFCGKILMPCFAHMPRCVCTFVCVCVNRHRCQPPDGDPGVLPGKLSYLDSRSWNWMSKEGHSRGEAKRTNRKRK